MSLKVANVPCDIVQVVGRAQLIFDLLLAEPGVVIELELFLVLLRVHEAMFSLELKEIPNGPSPQLLRLVRERLFHLIGVLLPGMCEDLIELGLCLIAHDSQESQ